MHKACQKGLGFEGAWNPDYSQQEEERDIAIIKLLLEAGAYLHSRTMPDGRTPLHLAARWNNIKAVQALVDAGACTSVMDWKGRRPVDETNSEEIKRIIINASTMYSR